VAWEDDLATTARERWSSLVGYAYLLTGDLPRSEDLVQEAFTRAFGRPRRVKDPAVIHSYLRSTVLRIVIDDHRREQLFARSRHLVAAADSAPSEEARIESRMEVQAALGLLPPRERACIVLRYYDDLTVPALAAELGISTGTAKRYLSDAVQRLEGSLGDLDAPVETAHVQLIDGSER